MSKQKGDGGDHEVWRKIRCHKCDVELERQGMSEFGKCPECGRKMLFREWQKLQDDGGGGESSSDVRVSEEYQGLSGDEVVDKVKDKHTICAGCQHLKMNCSCDEPSGGSGHDSSKSGGEPPKNLELPTAAYAIIDQRNGDIWNVNTEDRLLEAEAQQMGDNHVLEDLVRRQDAEEHADNQYSEGFLNGKERGLQLREQAILDLIDQRIEEIKENKVDAAHSRVFELEWLRDKIAGVEKKNAEEGDTS